MTTTEHYNGHPVIDWREYDHFREFNWGHDWIADRLGVTPASLTTALHRRAARDRDAERAEVTA